jgi:GntR family transcriptional repressor for pyruvate dehydrogenase complex
MFFGRKILPKKTPRTVSIILYNRIGQTTGTVNLQNDMNSDNLFNLGLKPIKQNTVTEQVAQQLLALLSKGVLKPGDRLPPERQLAKEMNVGRTTIREALKLLTINGLLETRRGDGTYVRQDYIDTITQQLDWSMMLDSHQVDLVLEVRIPLEIQVASLAAERATAQDLKQIEDLLEPVTLLPSGESSQPEADLQFHLAVVAASHNQLLYRLMYSMIHLLKQYLELASRMTESIESTRQEHANIYNAIAAHDARRAAEAMRAHLEISRELIKKSYQQHSESAKGEQL